MGLIKAGIGALGGTLADQWKEYFYCDALAADVLAAKGRKRTSSRSSNTKAEDNIISNGAVIAVNEGQCMMIVEQGKIVEFSAEAGEFRWDSSTEPSVFAGSLGNSILETFKTLGRRFAFGGDTGKDQRVYYFNLKEIVGNKYGTATPVPFRVVDCNIGLDVDIAIRCNGEYSYKLTDPMRFFVNVCGNVSDVYTRAALDSQLKSELLTALQPAFARIGATGVRYSALPAHTHEIADALNQELSRKWGELRGICIASFGINSVSASPEDEEMIKNLQKTAVMRDPSMAAATLTTAQAEAMKAAASNQSGAMNGFIGMGFAQQAGGVDAGALYQMAGQQKPATDAAGWVCACGAQNDGKFCSECGKAKPADDVWQCACGATNRSKFCSECGKARPTGFRCDQCGWTPAEGEQPPKFCPECGDRFDQNDKA
ncbi:MAG: SPFH domain-containing protein [Clostridia bacterium]|nr:SPFH domain-containing protein [Clostridia bacterium]